MRHAGAAAVLALALVAPGACSKAQPQGSGQGSNFTCGDGQPICSDAKAALEHAQAACPTANKPFDATKCSCVANSPACDNDSDLGYLCSYFACMEKQPSCSLSDIASWLATCVPDYQAISAACQQEIYQATHGQGDCAGGASSSSGGTHSGMCPSGCTPSPAHDAACGPWVACDCSQSEQQQITSGNVIGCGSYGGVVNGQPWNGACCGPTGAGQPSGAGCANGNNCQSFSCVNWLCK